MGYRLVFGWVVAVVLLNTNARAKVTSEKSRSDVAQMNSARASRSDQLQRYETADRTEYYEFHEKAAVLVYVYPKVRLEGEKFPPDEWDIWGNAPVRDCSDQQYRCVLFDGMPIAVPRSVLTPAAEYSVAGGHLRIAKCERGTDAVCQVALVAVECHFDAYAGDHGACVDAPSKATHGVRGRQLYFWYNQDFGVTSFGFGERASSLADMREKAGEYHLISNEGVLRE